MKSLSRLDYKVSTRLPKQYGLLLEHRAAELNMRESEFARMALVMFFENSVALNLADEVRELRRDFNEAVERGAAGRHG